MPSSLPPQRLRRGVHVVRVVALGWLAVWCLACAPSRDGPAASPSAVPSVPPTTAPTARPSPTPRPGAAAITAFVERVTSGTFSYRLTLKGTVAAAVDRGQVTGRLDTSGRDYAMSLTFDFTEDYPGSALFKVGVREVDGAGFLREDGDKWRTVPDYVATDSAVPFASVASEADIVYRETFDDGGEIRHRPRFDVLEPGRAGHRRAALIVRARDAPARRRGGDAAGGRPARIVRPVNETGGVNGLTLDSSDILGGSISHRSLEPTPDGCP